MGAEALAGMVLFCPFMEKEMLSQLSTQSQETWHCIAIIKDNDQLALYNLKTGEEQLISTDKCASAFTGYCIDTAYFEGVNFVYKWGKDAHMNSGDEIIKRKKVKWY